MSRSLQLSLWLGVLLACNGGKDTGTNDADDTSGGDADTDADSDTDTDTDTDADCSAVITSVTPADGATDVPTDTTVVVSFDQAIPTTGTYSISMPGVTGTTELASDAMSMTFTPDAPLDPGQAYTADAYVCSDTASTSFTTVGTIDPSVIVGRTYGLPWNTNSITVTEPPNGGPLFFSNLFPIDYVMLEVQSVDPVTGAAPSAATVGYDNGGVPEAECLTVVQETADFSQNPLYQFSGDLTILLDPTAGTTADIEDFQMTGTFSADGSQLTDVHLHGLVATEEFFGTSYLLGGCESPAVALFQPTCVPCTISRKCMVVEMDAPVVTAFPAFDLSAECSL